MKVDLLPFEAWDALNEAVARELSLSTDASLLSTETTLRCYPGLTAAVYELALGTAQFYSHKRSIAMLPGQTPHFETVLPYFYKEGYEVQIKPESTTIHEWIDGLKKDTCFVLLTEDHAVTAELRPPEELAAIEKIFNDKKIFCFKLSHSNHLYRPEAPLPYTARICGFNPRTTVALLGSRMKAPTLMASTLDWESETFLTSLRQTRAQAKENRALVEKFEKKLPAGFRPLLTTPHRCFDRALIYSETLGGEALQQFLTTNLRLPLRKPGWETRIETTHLCRWGGTRSYDSWWKPRPAESILRGLLILGVEILDDSSLEASLQKALQECQIAQLG